MAMLSKVVRKLKNFSSRNSLKLSSSNIRSNFFGCESLLQSDSPNTFDLCEINLKDSIDFSNFSVRGHLAIFQRDRYSYAWSLFA